MDLQLAGKHVLITGGSRGIGYACAQLFLQEGARVSIASRTPEHLDAARDRLGKEAPGELHAHAVDLTDPAAAAAMVDAAVAAGGPIDVLVNSAGAARRTPFHELTPAHWHAAMQAKFFTYVHATDPVIKQMGQRRSGTVVNIIGMGGKLASPTHLAGGAANAALMLATAGLAAAYGPLGVRVNAVNPSSTLTDRMTEGLAADARLRGITPAEALQQATSRAPLGRLATPEDIANIVAFLASSKAGYLSGAIVSADGGAVPMVV